MYKILLVDDEILVREAIRDRIQWNELGFELIGDCENGSQAVEFVKNDRVDLVLTDIYMPHMDGLELSKYLYENYPDTAIVIFSGYSDFDYAKKAIQYRVSEYILKPVTAKELSETLIKIKEKLDMKSREKKKLTELTKGYHTYAKNEAMIVSKTLTKLVKGTESVEKSLEDLNELGIKIQKKSYRLAAVDIDAYSERHVISEEMKKESALMAFIVENISAEVLKEAGEGIAFQDTDNRIYMLFYTNKVKEHEQYVIGVCNKIKELVYNTTHLSISIGIGKLVDDVYDLKSSYDSALEILKFRYSKGDGQIYDAEAISNSNDIDDIENYFKQISDSIIRGNEQEVNESLDLLEEKMRSNTMERNVIIVYLNQLQRVVYETISSIDDGFELRDYDIKVVTEAGSLKYAMSLIRKYIADGMSLLSETNSSFKERLTLMALNYLNDNYDNAELTLNDLCSHLGISISYFSSIFKETTGGTFTEAITGIRMEKAKTLLAETSLKNYEIAERVGFNDPHYFNIAFKKMTGVTPKKYSREIRDEKEV